MLRNNKGQFQKGNEGFWLGKRRPNISRENNPRWVGEKNERICRICKKRFRRGNSTAGGISKYCSMKCYGLSKKGSWIADKNPRWNNGSTEPDSKIRHSDEYREWRRKVYQKDRWTCWVCKRHLKRLIAHHIKSFKKYPKLRFQVSNGITLCRACHCELHAKWRDCDDFTKILRDYMSDTH